MIKKHKMIFVVTALGSGIICSGALFGAMKYKEKRKCNCTSEQLAFNNTMVLNAYDIATNFADLKQMYFNINERALIVLSKIVSDYEEDAEKTNDALYTSLMANFSDKDARKITGVRDTEDLWNIIRFGKIDGEDFLYKFKKGSEPKPVVQRDGETNILKRLIRANKIWNKKHKEKLHDYQVAHGDRYDLNTYRFCLFSTDSITDETQKVFWNLAKQGMYNHLCNSRHPSNPDFKPNVSIHDDKIVFIEQFKKTVYDFCGTGIDINNPYVARYINEINGLINEFYHVQEIQKQRDVIVNLHQQANQIIR